MARAHQMNHNMNKSLDQVILVNRQDRKIGEMDKVEAHRGEGRLHRAISVFLFNTKGDLLIQQRSEKKMTCGLQWANTCCGNVRPGETYMQCAHRRLQEELGIVGVKLSKITKFSYSARCSDEFSENEIDTVFTGVYDGELVENPDEVHATRWIAQKDFIHELERDVKKKVFVPWINIMKEKNFFGIIRK